MNAASRRVQKVYLLLLLLHTLAASFIWGINTLFLLDAGLTLARRILRRERWWQPHVTHAFQHAARRHGHVRVTGAFGAWTLLGACIAASLRDIAFTSIIISLLPWYVVGAAAWWLLQRQGTSPVVENRE